MKRLLCILILGVPLIVFGQITTPQIKARFGVDADLRANYFNGLVQTGNDDWFNLVSTDTSGKSVIDTTGSAAIVAGYLADVSPYPRRMATMYRTMNRPGFSIVNNRLWLSALWVRDYHGNDTTVFTSGADKNGMSPALWSGGIQGIPDKNDILDIFVHIRRAGPASTDSLWMFGGLSLDNITGNRYFDFEMYQTDINYDRVSHQWYGYGPDAGHTSWEFDSTGKITKPGDIIFSAEYQSSTLTNIEARIWVKKTVWQTITPTAFSWSGQFDGDGASAVYGYASIQPKTVGAFYTGLASGTNTWPGPFRLILQNNTLTNSYAKDQFMEFSVNLSKLGLDPVTQTGGDICGTPFNRIVIKTRASSSFTAELKDFVAPTDFFLAPRVKVASILPLICDTGSVANIYVTNPVTTSVYQWSTTNGRIVGPTSGPSIFVDTPGVYIVRQYLQAGCTVYASDTITLRTVSPCIPLEKVMLSLGGSLQGQLLHLDWDVLNNYAVSYFDVESCTDGKSFRWLAHVEADDSPGPNKTYQYEKILSQLPAGSIFFRIKLVMKNGRVVYSNIIRLQQEDPFKRAITFTPNPVKNIFGIEISSSSDGPVVIYLTDMSGKQVFSFRSNINKGYNYLRVADLSAFPPGMYQARVFLNGQAYAGKIIVLH